MDDFVDYFLAESKRKDKVPAKSSKRHQCGRVRFEIPPAYLPNGAVQKNTVDGGKRASPTEQ